MSDELQRFIDSLADPVLVLDPDFRIVRANQALLQSLDCSANEVVGRQCHEIGHNRSMPCVPSSGTCPAAEVWNGKATSRSIHVHPSPDGSKRYVEIVASLLTDEEDQTRRVVEVMRDVTAQKLVGAKLV